MGVVYKARDTHLDRLVAIKILSAEAVADPGRKRRFTLEAKAASALNHPGIITIYDIAEDGGIAFIAMEYVQGKTLGELIGRKGLRLKDTLTYAGQAAGASESARRRDRTSGSEAIEHHGDRRRSGEDPRLRRREADDGRREETRTGSPTHTMAAASTAHRGREDRRHRGLHVTGAG